ncbi:EscU/YscU/HrcU family type III secretion system export apparatus switch protein [Paenibacillus yanchengensis]|uniref:EscU/YscU/HrcU family type III secretion system export apparatus switch protein n=1 Tax=Paenibacillus yanchengensis TaxID=2035833 RepID=A0ABW4YMM7_9BACL
MNIDSTDQVKQRLQGQQLAAVSTYQKRKAVALKYDPTQEKAPTIAAKGQGVLADRIIELANEHKIPIQQDASLIEVLSKLDVEQEIPPELFTIVAEILSFVYRADQEAKDWLQAEYEQFRL